MRKQRVNMMMYDSLDDETEQKLLLNKIKQRKQKWIPKTSDVQTVSIQKKGEETNVPPFLPTLRIACKNLHNCLVDSGAQGNIMPVGVWKTLNIPLSYSPKKVTQLDQIEVKVIEMLIDVHIQIASEPRIQQRIDVQVVEIPDIYGMLLSINRSRDMNEYISIDWSHLWLPWRGIANQIRLRVNQDSSK